MYVACNVYNIFLINKSCRTDLNTDEFIQHMCNTQVSFEAVQKDSNNSTMQIEEK